MDPRDEVKAMNRRYGAATAGRIAPLGQNLVGMAAQAYAHDGRYIHFVTMVEPLQWMVAAQNRDRSLAQVTQAILDSGPSLAVLRWNAGMTVAEWIEAIIVCYRAAVASAVADDEPEEATPPPYRGYAFYNDRDRDSYEAPARQDATVAPGSRPSGPEALAPAEKAATKWSAGKDMPRHRVDRPSQTPGPRHIKYVKAKATQWNCTEKEADMRITSHPADCPWQAPS